MTDTYAAGTVKVSANNGGALAAQAAYQIQMDDRIPVPDWIERYLP